MLPFRRGAPSREPLTLPLFPAEDRAVSRRPAAAQGVRAALHRHDQGCLKDDTPFGVCLFTRGEEVARRGDAGGTPEFALIGTLARITSWDMPQLGILQLKTEGGTRFQVQSHRTADDGLVMAQVTLDRARAERSRCRRSIAARAACSS